MSQLLPLKEWKEVFFYKDTLPLASKPLWFLKTSITEVAWGACASKSSMQDALPSDWLPEGHGEVTLKCMCGGADTDAKRKTALDKEREGNN